MNRSEAGKLGQLKSREKLDVYNQQFITDYMNNPKFCLQCNEVIPYEKRLNNFCNHSCSSKYTNKNRKRNPDTLDNCIQCGEPLKKISSTRKYCSKRCQHEYQYQEYIKRWKQGLENGITGKVGTSANIRRYLFEKFNDSCSDCGWNRVHPVTGKVPLQIEHIDGNWKNNAEDNLKLLCGACHSLTETYGALNKGNGRELRYK